MEVQVPCCIKAARSTLRSPISVTKSFLIVDRSRWRKDGGE